MTPDRRDDEAEGLGQYLELAREIRREIERFTSDDSALADSLGSALDAIPRRERERLAQATFDRLGPDQQWQVIERVFDDAEVRALLETRRARRVAEAKAAEDRRAVVNTAVRADCLDLLTLPDGATLTLGLFRPRDVRAAIGRGQNSDVCARSLELRTTPTPGSFRVIDDVFNPRGGLFVSAEYDQALWRSERLVGHSTVRVGSLAGATLEPTLYLGGRVDVGTDGATMAGHLHLGFALIAGEVAFPGPSA